MHHFLATQRLVHRAYRDLFKHVETAVPGAKAATAATGYEMLELLAKLAERGLYGPYEQVAR